MKNKKYEDIKVTVTFTEGYQQRFTQACLDVLQKRENCKRLEQNRPEGLHEAVAVNS